MGSHPDQLGKLSADEERYLYIVIRYTNNDSCRGSSAAPEATAVGVPHSGHLSDGR